MAEKMVTLLKQEFRVSTDFRQEHSLGYRLAEAEVKGIPLRLELGLRDLEKKEVVMALRNGTKKSVGLDSVPAEVKSALDNYQRELFSNASAFMAQWILEEDHLASFEKRLEEGGMFQLHWCGSAQCETLLKEKTKATLRCIPWNAREEKGKCIACQAPSNRRVLFARSY